jgi:hypothetical protein
MEARVDYTQASPAAVKAMSGLQAGWSPRSRN